jgi:hypothetical protein
MQEAESGAFQHERSMHQQFAYIISSLTCTSHLLISLAMAAERREIIETDDSGNITATYVQTAWSKASLGRVDVIYPQETKAVWQRVLDVFLPAGYPHSVTSDYLE